ncbi:nuclear transport factor 2 family protein [Nitrospirillum bahiense]|uniref:SnoaL-like protein n=1 Tax=Nitrospirillum amazonense TaxID=28077 RepID=A0A560FC51_9PROT|nr:nuclear transport factor 2 family protein [Nitrospirillum amazonense]TWB19183.1 SnoaL-like protein [Nitrospirillum amazonense]
MKPPSKFGLLMLALFSTAAARGTHAAPAQTQVLDTAPATNEQIAAAQTLIDKHFALWNSNDMSKYRQAYDAIYAKNFLMADYSGVARSYDDVVALIQKVQAAHPGFHFTPKPVAINHGLGRVTWGYGPADDPTLITGEDIFTIEDGKITSLRVFLNK